MCLRKLEKSEYKVGIVIENQNDTNKIENIKYYLQENWHEESDTKRNILQNVHFD